MAKNNDRRARAGCEEHWLCMIKAHDQPNQDLSVMMVNTLRIDKD